MARGALAFPVLPGKGEADLRRIAERFKKDPEGYWESRRSQGVSFERAYWQHTPMGDFVVAYVESTKGTLAEAFGAAAQDTTPIGRFFAETVKDVHGIDITQPPEGPPPEIVAEWSDPQVTARGKGLAFMAPIIPEMEAFAKTWAADAYSRDGMTESRRALKQNLEIVSLMHTPQGPATVVYVEGEDPVRGNVEFAASTSEFDMWFKENLSKIYPPFIDFSQPIPGLTEIFDSESLASVDVTGRSSTEARTTA
jgi:hypothetical protein